jgi:hypothetical protein
LLVAVAGVVVVLLLVKEMEEAVQVDSVLGRVYL